MAIFIDPRPISEKQMENKDKLQIRKDTMNYITKEGPTIKQPHTMRVTIYQQQQKPYNG